MQNIIKRVILHSELSSFKVITIHRPSQIRLQWVSAGYGDP